MGNYLRRIKRNAGYFKKGLQTIIKADSALARQAIIVKGQIPVYGKLAVVTNLIKQIKKDCKQYYKKGGKTAVENVIKTAIATPEYMSLLEELDMSDTHLYLLAEEVTGEKFIPEVGETLELTGENDV